jgi:Rps23 Pro-64 3,4-dihydroxylase Tpa1-like proline 4-hydroxylase
MESVLKNELFNKGYVSFHLSELNNDLFLKLEKLFPIETLKPSSFRNLRNSIIELNKKSPYKSSILDAPFDELEIIKNDILENYTNGVDNSVDQIWYFDYPKYINESAKLAETIFKTFYDSEFKGSSQLTMYNDGCYLINHQDASYSENKPNCVILIYLTHNYIEGNGGELIIEHTNIVKPIFGNVAILDFTKHNPFHAVEKVKNYNRFCYINFC